VERLREQISTARRATIVTSLMLASVGLVGCGDSSLVPVEGTITLDGRPLVGATIALEHVDREVEKRVFAGDTDGSGHYVISPVESGSTGVPPGEYRIVIRSVKAPPGADEMTELPPEPVPSAYRNGTKTLVIPAEGITNADVAIKTR
jgi:hypothetical protein